VGPSHPGGTDDGRLLARTLPTRRARCGRRVRGRGYDGAAAGRGRAGGGGIAGKAAGLIQSFEGGEAYADVLSVEVPGPFADKHLGGLQYADMIMQVDLGADRGLIDWIAESFSGSFPRRDGVVQMLDSMLNVRSERAFVNALIAEIGFPASDGASKDRGYLTLKVAPEYTRTSLASGKMAAPLGKVPSAMWLTNSFRIEIDGVDCKQVSRIEPFAIKQQVTTDTLGQFREPVRQAGRIEFPNLTVTLSERSASTWIEWYEDFVVNGKSTADRERSGRIVFLSADVSRELFQVTLQGIGIMRLAPERLDANADSIRRMKAQLYCERMELQYLG
jgi:hypothetical protein